MTTMPEVDRSSRRWARWRRLESTSVVGRAGFIVGTAAAVYGVFQLTGQYEPVLYLHDSEFILVAVTAMVTGACVSGIGAGRALRDGNAAPATYVRAIAGPTLLSIAYLLVAIVGFRAIGGIGWPDLLESIAVPLEVLAGTAVGLGAGAAGARLPRWATGAIAVVLAIVLAGTGLLTAGAGPWTELEGSVSTECSTRGRVEYCAFPGYGAYIQRWQAVVEPVLAAAPPEVAAGPWQVIQDDSDAWIRGTLATTGRAWGRGVGVPYATAGIAVQVGDVLTGATTDVSCAGVLLRGRVVTALWLAGQAGSDVRAYLASDDPAADAITGSQMAATPPVVGSLSERHAAARLLSADTGDVRDYIHANWTGLTGNPCTSAAELLQQFAE